MVYQTGPSLSLSFFSSKGHCWKMVDTTRNAGLVVIYHLIISQSYCKCPRWFQMISDDLWWFSYWTCWFPMATQHHQRAHVFFWMWGTLLFGMIIFWESPKIEPSEMGFVRTKWWFNQLINKWWTWICLKIMGTLNGNQYVEKVIMLYDNVLSNWGCTTFRQNHIHPKWGNYHNMTYCFRYLDHPIPGIHHSV